MSNKHCIIVSNISVERVSRPKLKFSSKTLAVILRQITRKLKSTQNTLIMGHYSAYKCKECNYVYEGTCGRESGKFGYTYDTFNCKDCKKTFDFGVLYEAEELNGETTFADVFCNSCKGKDIEVWDRKCPCCNSKMVFDWKPSSFIFGN